MPLKEMDWQVHLIVQGDGFLEGGKALMAHL